MFPSGFGYEKSNDGARTPKSERYFGSIQILLTEISNTKKGRTNS